MKVFFGTTTYQWEKYKKNYFMIRDYLVELNNVILFDWIDKADKNIRKRIKERDIKQHFREITKAISEADASVIEFTIPRFSSSHQINFSLLRRKPTLVLFQKKPNSFYKNSYLEGMDTPLLTLAEYNNENYKNIIRKFIGVTEQGSGMGRYDFVLDKRCKYYLDWAAAMYKKSRSEIVREMIEEKMKNDEKYSTYLMK